MNVIFISKKKEIKNKNVFIGDFVLNKKKVVVSNIKQIFQKFKLNEKLYGSFSLLYKENGFIYLLRDQNGIFKLFYCFDYSKSTLYVSNNFLNLLKFNQLSNIFSVMPGSLIRISISKKNITVIHQKKLFSKKKINNQNLLLIKKKMDLFFDEIKKYNFEKTFISLSGGLDSSMIAYLAKHKIKELEAITAVLMNNEEIEIFTKTKEYDKAKYFDLANAEKIAKKLNIVQTVVPFSDQDIFQNFHEILYSCQDWRDYNVHCACINFFIAKKTSYDFPNKKICVLTGDFMNEIFADYTEETINKNKFYKQIKAPNLSRQRFFIRGLDSSDREVGVYNYFGIKCFQPFSIVLDDYIEFGQDLFEYSNPKYEVNSFFLSKEIFDLVGEKKTRAQTGDLSGGILACFINNNYNQEKITETFCKKFNVNSKDLSNFIVAGRYRSFEN